MPRWLLAIDNDTGISTNSSFVAGTNITLPVLAGVTTINASLAIIRPDGTSTIASRYQARDRDTVSAGTLVPGGMRIPQPTRFVTNPSYELEDHFGARLLNQWRVDPNKVTLVLGDASVLKCRVTDRVTDNLVQTTAAKRLTYVRSSAVFGGRPALSAGGSARGHNKSIGSSTCASAAFPYIKFIVFAATDTIDNDCRLMGPGDASRWFEVIANTNPLLAGYNGGTATLSGYFDPTSRLAHMLIVGVYDNQSLPSVGVLYRSDGLLTFVRRINFLSGVAGGTLTLLNAGFTPNQGFPGIVADAGQISGLLANSDIGVLLQYAIDWFGFTAPDREVLFDGNSLMMNAKATMDSIVLTSNPTRFNAAVGGRDILDVLAGLKDSASLHNTGFVTTRRCWCWTELSNSILGGASLATVQADFRAAMAEARALGFDDIVTTTCMARIDITGAAEVVRAAANAWLASDWVTEGIDALVNMHTATVIDGQSCPATLLDPTDVTYFVDGIHLTVTGLPIWAEQFRVRLTALGY